MYTVKGKADKNSLLTEHMPLVKRLAHQMKAKLPPSVEVDDLVQAGMMGLLDAINRYEENHGAQFETYAVLRIRGAMLDELRRVLRPGGRILIFVPTFRWLWGVQDDISHHRRRYRLPELRRALMEAGFEVERTTYANITFLLPTFLGRLFMRLTGIKPDSENRINVAALNPLFARILGSEATFLRFMNFPIGVSGLCVARAK